MRRKSLVITTLITSAVLIGLYFYLLNKAEFTKGSHAWASKEVIEESEVIYLGYNLTFNGYGSPTIQSIYLQQTEGEKGQQYDEQISISVFIDKNNRIGAVDEKYALDEGIIDELIPVRGYKLKESDFNLAIRVELKDKDFKKDFDTLVIEYSHLGVTKKQVIDFEGLFH